MDGQVASPAIGGQALTIEQRAKLGGFLGLSLKNGLLNIITLTLYRFWGRTEVRRRVWSSTYVNGEALEYTGRGMELFVGFLLAVAFVGAPFLLVAFAGQLAGPVFAVLIMLPFYLFLIFLMGVGQFTAFRYLASRTAWRGVRFRLRGSALGYAGSYFGYGLLSAITLGWFWPAAHRRLSGRLWGGLSFGDRAFAFDLKAARKVGIYGPYALGWAALVVVYVLFAAAIMGTVAPAMMAAAKDGQPPPPPDVGTMGLIYLFAIIASIALMAAFAPYHAAFLRSVAAGTAFEGARFKLKLGGGVMAGLLLRNIALTIVSLGFLLPYVQARTLKFLINRLQSEGAVELEHVRQSADAGPRAGEGLADAFGISPI